MRIAWLTDIHLNFVDDRCITHLIRDIEARSADAVVISGDIGEADSVADFLRRLSDALPGPLYFVLGNHDFYRGSIAEVRAEISRLGRQQSGLVYLSDSGVHRLTNTCCILGHDGWPDGRLGNYEESQVLLSDFLLIRDFRRPEGSGHRLDAATKTHWLTIMQRLSDQAARHIDEYLPKALADYPETWVITHVPPFAEACWYHGRISNDDFLPFFSSQAMGDVLLRHADQFPTRHVTVLCGHTHGGGEVQVRPNLKVVTGSSEYGEPTVQRVFDLG